MPTKIAILVSGRGSNLAAIQKAIESKELTASISVVLSNDASAPALEIARNAGIPAVAVPNAGLSRTEHEEKVSEALSLYTFDWLILAGYMRVLSGAFLKKYQDKRGFFRVVNIHPSLLPEFPGKDAYEQAFNAGVARSGVTVHLVDEQVDHGPILGQETFVRNPDDTLETFKARGLSIEHKLYPRVLQELALGHFPDFHLQSAPNERSKKVGLS